MILDLLRRVCNKLEENSIEYMLSGSIALNLYSVPRMTRDIDIVINLNPQDIEKFVSAFEEGYYCDEEDIKYQVRMRGMFNLIDHSTGNKIDFIVRKNTAYRLTEFGRKKRDNSYGFDAWVVSLEDLIISKLDWIQQLKSEKQILDVENLLTNEDVDLEYVKEWCRKLKLKTYGLIDYE